MAGVDFAPVICDLAERVVLKTLWLPPNLILVVSSLFLALLLVLVFFSFPCFVHLPESSAPSFSALRQFVHHEFTFPFDFLFIGFHLVSLGVFLSTGKSSEGSAALSYHCSVGSRSAHSLQSWLSFATTICHRSCPRAWNSV
jgi:hypothetical protein